MVRIGITNLACNCSDNIRIKPVILIFLFILTTFNSCIRIEIRKNEKPIRAEGFVMDIISKEPLSNAKVKILEWHKGFLWGGSYSVETDSCYTDVNGHFQINFLASEKYNYTFRISKELYFKDEGFPVTLTSVNKVNIGLFPYGYIKTHIINNIDSAKYIEVFITPFYSSQEIFREGFINCYLFKPSFADTSFITTTAGGVMNQLKIIIYTKKEPDRWVVKDTSFQTMIHDTVRLDKLILF